MHLRLPFPEYHQYSLLPEWCLTMHLPLHFTSTVTLVLLAAFPLPGRVFLASVSGSSWSLISLEKRVCVPFAVLQAVGALPLVLPMLRRHFWWVWKEGSACVGVAAFCGCFQPAATCSGGKRLRFLSGGLACSQLSCLAVMSSTCFPPEQ